MGEIRELGGFRIEELESPFLRTAKEFVLQTPM